MKPIFVKTKNMKGFINLIHNLKNKPENITKIGLVYGNAGLGKTKTALYLSLQYDAIYHIISGVGIYVLQFEGSESGRHTL